MNNKMLMGLAAAFVAAVAFVLLQPNTQIITPPQGGMVPNDTSGVAQGEPLAEVRVPASFSPDALIGQRGFEAKCAVCHGINAAGQNGVAPPLVHQIYRPGHHSDMAFVVAAQRGVTAHHWKFGNMPQIKGLTDSDIKYIARYIRELQIENGIN